MTVPSDPRPYLNQLISRLTGRGGDFEITMGDVLGSEMPVMKNRDRAVADLLSQSLVWGDREYLVTWERRISFAEHAREAYALAAALRERYGVGVGDRVAILSANRLEWVTAFWATQALGAITVGSMRGGCNLRSNSGSSIPALGWSSLMSHAQTPSSVSTRTTRSCSPSKVIFLA